MIRYLTIFVLLLASPALADVTIHKEGTSSGATSEMPQIRLPATDGGVSIFTIPTNENLVYAMIPEAMYETGISNGMNRNMGTAGFSGSTGWYLKDGLLTHYAADEIPIELHAGIYGVPLSAGVTNYLIYSSLFSDANWTKTRSGVTAGAEDPMGTNQAMAWWVDGTAASNHQLGQTRTAATFADNTLSSLCGFAAPNTLTWTYMRFASKQSGDIGTAYINLATGEVGTTSGVSAVYVSPELYNGFRRIGLTRSNASGGGNPVFGLYQAEGDGDITIDGDGISGITIFGMQVSETPSCPPYIPSDGSIEVWSGNANALTYNLATMASALDGTVDSVSGTSLWGEQLGAEVAAGALTVGNLYKITADDGGHWFGSPVASATGMYFTEESGTTTADANNKVKQVLNAWDSGTTSELSPPHFTMLTWLRPISAKLVSSLMPPAAGLITVADSDVGLFYHGTTDMGINDGTTAIGVGIGTWPANKWIIFGCMAGVLNSNVSQMRCGYNSGSEWSWGSWANYDGSFDVGSNLVWHYNGWNYNHYGPLLIYRTTLSDSFLNALGNGG